MFRLLVCAVMALAVLVPPASALAQETPTRATEAAAPAIDTGTTAWMLTATMLVLLMVPGLALFYGGLVRTKNVLGTMMHSFAAMAIIGVSWAVVGYAKTFGASQFKLFGQEVGGLIGWDSSYLLLRSLDSGPGAIYGEGHSVIPHLVFAMF